MDKFNLNRFIKAQEETYSSAMDEIKSGSKYGHWMWFIYRSVFVGGLSRKKFWKFQSH